MKKFVAASLSIMLAGFVGNVAHEPLSDAKLESLWREPQRSAETILSQMTLREKIGQMLMLDVRKWSSTPGKQPESVEVLPHALVEAIYEYRLGSIILFRENLVNTTQTYKLAKDIQNARYNLPLIIGTDQEGGLVTRLRVGTEMPGNMALAAGRNASMAYGSGEVHGIELSALGFNINFAPSVDVNVNQNNPVIGVRSFGSNVELVSDMAVSYIKGLEKNNVTATIKHFPGHGNVDIDSHFGLPVVPYSEKEWRENDFVPFKYAVEHGVKAIMTAHIVVPALDDTKAISKKDGTKIGVPATLSKKILHNILREELKYDGLIMTDALEMAAIAENFGSYEAVEQAFLAGVDIAMMPVGIRDANGIAKLAGLFAYIEKQCEVNPELARRIDESALRVVKFKLDNKLVPHPIHSEAHAHEVIASAKHKFYERLVAERAVTLIENQGVLPYSLSEQSSNNILIISDEPARNEIIKRELGVIQSELKSIAIGVDTETVKLAGNDVPAGVEAKIQRSDLIILVTYNLKKQGGTAAQTIVNKANALNKPCVVISALNPYDISSLKNVKANLAIYGITGFDITNALRNLLEANIKAGIRSLFMDTPSVRFNKPGGKLPVDIKDASGGSILYPFGHGLHYN